MTTAVHLSHFEKRELRLLRGWRVLILADGRPTGVHFDGRFRKDVRRQANAWIRARKESL
jgi:hypothetical protein